MLVGDHIISWPYIFQKLIKVHIYYQHNCIAADVDF